MKCKTCEGHGVRSIVTEKGIRWSRLCDSCEGTGRFAREVDPFEQTYLDGLAEIHRRHERRVTWLVVFAIVSAVLLRTCVKQSSQPWKRPAVSILHFSKFNAGRYVKL